jgi:hypothetical protein
MMGAQRKASSAYLVVKDVVHQSTLLMGHAPWPKPGPGRGRIGHTEVWDILALACTLLRVEPTNQAITRQRRWISSH